MSDILGGNLLDSNLELYHLETTGYLSMDLICSLYLLICWVREGALLRGFSGND